MKRAAVLIVLLVFVAGLLFLLFEDGAAERRDRRGIADNASGGAKAGAAASNAGETNDDGAVVDEAHMRDDDPNRIDGPRLLIRGRVLAKDEAVAGARVEILRAPPAHLSLTYLWQRRTEDTPVIAYTKSTDGGHFQAGIARRTVVVIRASAPGHAPATLRVLVPKEGDIEDVTLRLGESGTVRGVVVSKSDEPIPNATVRVQSNDRQRATVSYETKTAEDGTFAVQDLARTGHQFTVTAEGYGSTRRHTNVATDQEVRVVLGPACVIEGHVTFAGGAPIPALRIAVETRDPVDAQLAGRGETTTDESGRFRLA
ncbi:MAG: carboxypeptidase regulatory-like domain-containing protein, partial [Planctomycetota bacterium]|nr:carboxypeptidase regulatory-like domain-containing protein [Planctomycetota bacterium]